jgi:peptidoglycan hydrolase-like protein with peptidoglycan-binding domain
MNTNALTGRAGMRALLIVIAVVVVIGAVVFMATSVRWQGDPSQSDLGPSEAQQNRAEPHAVQKSTAPQTLTEVQIRGYQEQLDTAGFPTGTDKGAMTPQTEAALRAYQGKNGLPVTGMLDEGQSKKV